MCAFASRRSFPPATDMSFVDSTSETSAKRHERPNRHIAIEIAFDIVLEITFENTSEVIIEIALEVALETMLGIAYSQEAQQRAQRGHSEDAARREDMGRGATRRNFYRNRLAT